VLGIHEDVPDDLAVLDSIEADDGYSIRVPGPHDFDKCRDVRSPSAARYSTTEPT
jgi:hypothetical protein